MTDDLMDALIRRLDVASEPDPAFASSTYAALLPRARAARVGDARRFGRLARDFRLVAAGGRWPSASRRVAMVGLVALLLLAAILALAVAGAVRPTIQNGPLIVSIRGEIQAVDIADGSARAILPLGAQAKGVSRSPDGRLVAFWTVGGDRSHLFVVDVNGQHRRELAPDLSLGWPDSIDTWSSDSRFLATEVILDGLDRIVVADVDTGVARVITPAGLVAQDPLWSPDRRWIAFTKEVGSVRSIAIIRTDGSGMRTVSGDLTHVGGPDTWSPDGKWIYLDDSGRVYRANVADGSTQRLTEYALAAYAPASSPDGTLISFMVDKSHLYWDLYVANSDGTGARPLLDHAENDGWSADSRYILAQWNPTDQPGGLAVVRPDGSEIRVVFPFETLCPPQPGGPQRCTDGMGWGQARP